MLGADGTSCPEEVSVRPPAAGVPAELTRAVGAGAGACIARASTGAGAVARDGAMPKSAAPAATAGSAASALGVAGRGAGAEAANAAPGAGAAAGSMTAAARVAGAGAGACRALLSAACMQMKGHMAALHGPSSKGSNGRRRRGEQMGVFSHLRAARLRAGRARPAGLQAPARAHQR
jgi:hypothetical protein